MSQESKRIECPNCGTEIDVNDILYHQLDGELKKKYQDELARERKHFATQAEKLQADKEALEEQKKAYEEQLADQVREQVRRERTRLQGELKKQAEEELGDQIKGLQTELLQKSEQVKELNRTRAEIERLKREKDELRGTMELEIQQKMSKEIAEERLKIRKLEEERAAMKLLDREQVINQLKQQLQEAQRRAEQGSMQLQGEVQELAIEDWLAEQFPLDSIEEIKKGAQGADCLQVVNTRSRQNCGSIYYESKRTKSFQPGWIEKFKADIQSRNASIGVLVTEAMPADMERLGLRDGVWVCSYEEFKGLCIVLRESIIRLSSAVSIQENKGDKMGMLYDFLTGNEFRMQIEAIVEGFTQMHTDLASEKRSMQGIWKKREKQIEKVLLNTNHMYSSIRGIAGNAVQAVPQLELPDDEDDSDDVDYE